MTNNNAIVVMLGLFLISIVALIIVIIVTNHKHKQRIEEISLYQINTSANIDSSIPQILDIIIQESFRDYQIKCLIPLEEAHINSEREAEIRKDLVDLVTRRISNAALDKLSLFYNIANIAEILADKIYIIVMNFVIEHNKKMENE